MTQEYENFFKLIDDTLQKQKAQKKRGLNNYNMVNVVRKATHEVGMHSNIIYSLINPDGNHYQGDLFLNIFIKEVLCIEDFGNIFEVQAEEITNRNRRIDFTIKSDKFYIGIEMKINANDLKAQIQDYYKDLKDKAQKDNNQTVKIYYLTKNGKDASEYSHNNIDYKRISFEKHILNWINKSQGEVRNITNLNEAFENYKNIVKKIIKTYKGNIVTIVDELKKDITHVISFLEIAQHTDELKGYLLFNFLEKLTEDLQKKKYKCINFDNKYLFNEKKCKSFFTKANDRDKEFGIFFDIGLKDNLYFHLNIATYYLHYGLVKLKNENEKYTIEPLENLSKFPNELESRIWGDFLWFSKNYLNIYSFNKKVIKLLSPNSQEYDKLLKKIDILSKLQNKT